MMHDDFMPIVKSDQSKCFSMKDIKRQRKSMRHWIAKRVAAEKTAAEPPKLSDTMLYSGGGCYRAQLPAKVESLSEDVSRGAAPASSSSF